MSDKITNLVNHRRSLQPAQHWTEPCNVLLFCLCLYENRCTLSSSQAGCIDRSGEEDRDESQVQLVEIPSKS